MIGRSIGGGARRAWGQATLVSALWAWTALLALVVGIPAWSFWSGVLGVSIEAERLLDGTNLALLSEIGHYGRSAASSLLVLVAFVIGAFALAGSAFISGGVLEVLLVPAGGPFLHRFFRGGGRFMGRFVRLLLLTGAAVLLGLLATGVVSSIVASALAGLDWEPGELVAMATTVGLAGLAVAFFVVVQDYARIRVAEADSRGVFFEWLHAIGFVLRHPLGTASIFVVFTGVSGLLLVAALAIGHETPARSWGVIALVALMQQATIWLRAWLRVAMVGGEIELHRGLVPVPVAALAAPPIPPAWETAAPGNETVIDEAPAGEPSSRA